MILACRALFRFTDVRVQPKPLIRFQGSCSFYSVSKDRKMSGAKGTQGVVDHNKKRKTVNLVWRPVSSQASSIEGELQEVREKPSEEEIQVEGLHDSKSRDKHVVEATEAMNEMSVYNTSSSSLEKNIEDKPPVIESGISNRNHSLSMEDRCFKLPSYDITVWNMQVGASLIRFIRGKEGSTQKQIEEELGIKIILPSSKNEDSIVIEGNSVDSMAKASEKIQHIVDEAVRSRNLDYSHFISLPLAIHPKLVDKLVYFQNIILGNNENCLDKSAVNESNEDVSDKGSKEQGFDIGQKVGVQVQLENENEHVKLDLTRIPLVSYAPKASTSSYTPTWKNVTQSVPAADLGIEKSIFINPKTFHLTVLMLKLWNKQRVKRAAEVLQSVSSKVVDALDRRPVSIRLKGLDCMKGSLAKARVLYAPVEEAGSEDRLLRACQVIINAFVEAGLVLENDVNHKLKLHATLMNARHRKRKGTSRNVDSFDARGIFKHFGSENWGEYLISEAHLSQRFLYDESGYYHCCASIPFPQEMQVE